jgi:hypothetical protein
MTFELLNGPLAPAEDESVVRTYHTTTLSSGLLGLKAEGYLTVTNLRLVFYGIGSALAGKSILHSEVPLADVSGITSYKGSYFSFGHLALAAIVSFLVGVIASVIVTAIIGAIVFAVRSAEFAQIAVFAPVVVAAVFFFASFASPRDKISRSIWATCGAIMLAGIGGLGLASATFGSLFRSPAQTLWGGAAFFLALVGGIYALFCYFWYARRETMALAVSSKGGSSTPISISGIAGFGLFSGAALRSLTAEPAEDVEPMIKELGAMVTDIQAMGVHGISKWRVTR